jgi:hypothetical protein
MKDRSDRGDLVVWRDLEERRLELIALGDVDGMNAVWEPTSSSMIDAFQPFGVVQV